MRKALSEALATKIADRGLTQKAAADEIGTDKENVNRWLQDVEPGGEWVDGLMTFLDVSFDDLAILVLESKVRRAKRRAEQA
jgi:transcriptional regulator with XRE-family HTH domain